VSRLVVDKNPKSAISESIRSIRTNLDFISSAKKKRLISVTSTISGEGKTFVTVNLGGIIALSGQRVIILDLDMRKPKVNLAFGAENIKGVSTILIERHSVQECIQPTTIESLQFISAGPTPPNPSELILSDRFDQMLQELFLTYDVILIDTPPVGLVTDGILIMRKADIPLYIVRAGYSRKAFIKNMNRLMRSSNLTRMCTILNDAQSGGRHALAPAARPRRWRRNRGALPRPAPGTAGAGLPQADNDAPHHGRLLQEHPRGHSGGVAAATQGGR